MTDFEIHQLEKTDITKIASIHKSSLPDDFLPSLGMDFLEKIYYPAILFGKSSKTFVAYRKKIPAGFVVVSLNSKLMVNEIISYRKILFFFYLLKASLSSLKMLKMVLGIIFSGSLSYEKSDEGEIYTIAVDYAYRGQGIGRLLVDKAEEYLRINNLQGIMIKTLLSNHDWINFFIKNGWTISSKIKISSKEYVFLTKSFLNPVNQLKI